ncbi:MAG: polysaccharide deacetylase family protein [Chitinophagaceae bacterium]
MNYFIKTPWWLKKVYPNRIWSIDTNEKNIYLTFDDGPHPVVTTFVLDELAKYNAKASFFCIGKNVQSFPEIYNRIITEGHRVGNHTQNHLNGWETNNEPFLADVSEASKYIQSDLFRPPYGRIRSAQVKELKNYKIVMWDVLSGDFDESLSKEKCLQNVIRKTSNGSIVVFHDSEKAFQRLKYVLPLVLDFFRDSGYSFKSIERE